MQNTCVSFDIDSIIGMGFQDVTLWLPLPVTFSKCAHRGMKSFAPYELGEHSITLTINTLSDGLLVSRLVVHLYVRYLEAHSLIYSDDCSCTLCSSMTPSASHTCVGTLHAKGLANAVNAPLEQHVAMAKDASLVIIILVHAHSVLFGGFVSNKIGNTA